MSTAISTYTVFEKYGTTSIFPKLKAFSKISETRQFLILMFYSSTLISFYISVIHTIHQGDDGIGNFIKCNFLYFLTPSIIPFWNQLILADLKMSQNIGYYIEKNCRWRPHLCVPPC